MGLDKKQGEQEEKITKKTTLKNIHTKEAVRRKRKERM